MRSEHILPGSPSGLPSAVTGEGSAATAGAVAGLGALLSATACCILPLALGAFGLGSAGLSTIVPFHWPLTIAAVAAVTIGWLLYARKRRACAVGGTCTSASPALSTFVLLCLATLFVIISATWGYIEAPLMRALGGQ